MSEETLHFLVTKDRSRAKKLFESTTKAAKKKRQGKKADNLKKATNVAKLEKAQREGSYGPGIGLLGDVDDGYDSDLLTPAQRELTCRACGRRGHKTKANKLCPFYVPRVYKKKQKKTNEEQEVLPPAAATNNDDAADADRMDCLALNDACGSDDEFFDAEEDFDGPRGMI